MLCLRDWVSYNPNWTSIKLGARDSRILLTSKKENAWYREEIESSQRDTEEYIAYLESKKNEKLDVVHKLAESNKDDLETFVERRKLHEVENERKLNGLHD